MGNSSIGQGFNKNGISLKGHNLRSLGESKSSAISTTNQSLDTGTANNGNTQSTNVLIPNNSGPQSSNNVSNRAIRNSSQRTGYAQAARDAQERTRTYTNSFNNTTPNFGPNVASGGRSAAAGASEALKAAAPDLQKAAQALFASKEGQSKQKSGQELAQSDSPNLFNRLGNKFKSIFS